MATALTSTKQQNNHLYLVFNVKTFLICLLTDKMFTEFLEKADKDLLEKLLLKYNHVISKRVVRQNPTWAEFGMYIIDQSKRSATSVKASLLVVTAYMIKITKLAVDSMSYPLRKGQL